MKLSIIVPTYNQGPYIRQCLDSIEQQTLKDFEVLIQDSFSSDETQSICEEFVSKDARYKYFREKDAGQSDAINRGLARSIGEYWTWLCSDDLYGDPGALQAIVAQLDHVRLKEPNYVGAFGRAQFVNEIGEVLGEYPVEERDLEREDFKLNWPLSQPASIQLTQAVREVGGVDASLYLGMDLDLFIRLLNDGKRIAFTPSLIASVRLQPESKSLLYRKKTAENALQIISKHFGDSGSPLSSAFARELGIATRIEWTSQLSGRLKQSFPNKFPMIRKRIQRLRRRAFILMSPTLCKRFGIRGPGVVMFRLIWGSYRLVRVVARKFYWLIFVKSLDWYFRFKATKLR